MAETRLIRSQLPSYCAIRRFSKQSITLAAILPRLCWFFETLQLWREFKRSGIIYADRQLVGELVVLIIPAAAWFLFLPLVILFIYSIWLDLHYYYYYLIGPLSLTKLECVSLLETKVMEAVGSLCPALKEVHFGDNPSISPEQLESILSKWPKVICNIFIYFILLYFSLWNIVGEVYGLQRSWSGIRENHCQSIWSRTGIAYPLRKSGLYFALASV